MVRSPGDGEQVEIEYTQNNVQQGADDHLLGLKGGKETAERWWNDMKKLEGRGSHVPVGVSA